MKVIVTSKALTLDAPVDPRFGRATSFIFYDTETGDWKPVDNTQSINAASGAGIQAAETIARLGADIVLTGHCGPNAFRTLKAAGIDVVVGVEGTVSQAIEQLKNGELRPTDQADVEGHH